MNNVTPLTPDRAPSLAAVHCDNVVPMIPPAPVPADNAGSQKAVEFIKTVFGPVTEAPVWIQSLGNSDSDERSRHLATRDTAKIEGFIAEWDRDGRGAYFCVSTMRGIARTKENAAEIIGLHADIDFKDTDDTPADILRKVKALRCAPSRIHATGNGYHCFWLFNESAEATPEYQARWETALKQICDVVGGDQSVTHAAALMRLPGTHNSKRGQWTEVETIHQSDVRYELDDLEDWLAEQSPVILRKVRPAEVFDNNPHLAAAKARGLKPSIDVEKRLATMSFMAGGESAVHPTQLSVSASLLRGGTTTEDAVALILGATRSAAGAYGEKWNWAREEKAVRKMCSDWLRKHPSTTERPTDARLAQVTPAGTSEWSGPQFSEESIAFDFAKRHEENLRYVAKWGSWMQWDGTRWGFDETLRAFSLSRTFCREVALDCIKHQQHKTAQGIASASTVAAIERLAKADRALAATVDQWDTVPLKFNEGGNDGHD